MGNLKIDKNNGRVAEEVVLQEETDLDWGKIGTTTIPIQPTEYPLNPGTTTSTIFTDLKANDNEVSIVKSDNTIVKIDSTIPKEAIDTTQTLDILGDNSCVAAYPFDGNANDLSGNHNGTWSGTEAYVTGVYGQAANLSGDNDTITTDLVFGTDAKALSFWVYMIEAHGDGALFAQDGSGSPQNYIAFDINGNFRAVVGNTAILEFPSPSYQQWHHIVVQDTGSAIEAYVDGVKQTNSITTYNSLSGLQISNFGYYADNPSADSAHCYMDQVRIFNRALTVDEVVKLYYEQKTKYDITSLNLSNPPIKLFKDFKPPKVLVSLEEDKTNFISNMVEYPIPIYSGSTNTQLVTIDMLDGENVIIDNKDFAITSSIKLDSIDTSTVLDVTEDNSCVVTYQLDGNANDLSTLHNGTWKTTDTNGNVVDGTGAYDTGKYGQAASFNGSNWIEADDVLSPLTEFAISLWAKKNVVSDDSTAYRLLGWGTPGTNDQSVELRLQNNQFLISPYGTDIGVYLPFDYTVDFNNYVATYDNGKWIIYVNGERVSKFTHLITPVQNILNIANVANSTSTGVTFNGLIDQVRIFNRTLTESEVQVLYKEQKTKYNITSLSLTDAPKSVIRKGYIPLVKVSSTTTEFIGTNALDISLNTGDKVITDQGEVEVTTVNTEFTDSTQVLDILGDGSCIAAYPLDGNVNDLSGNYNCTATGDISFIEGKFGESVNYYNKDTTSYIKTNTKIINSENLTINFWIYINSTPNNGWESIIHLTPDDAANSGNSRQPGIWLNNDDNTRFHFRNDSTASASDGIWQSNGAIVLNKWHMITCIRTRTNLLLYINNELTDNYYVGDGNEFYHNDGYFYIGDMWDNKNYLIDQVRIFNKALTADEINKLYNEQIGKYTIDYNTLSATPNFVAIPQKIQEQPYVNTVFNGTNFVAAYDSILKQGRAIQRKFILPDDSIEIVPPITTKLYKFNS